MKKRDGWDEAPLVMIIGFVIGMVIVYFAGCMPPPYS